MKPYYKKIKKHLLKRVFKLPALVPFKKSDKILENCCFKIKDVFIYELPNGMTNVRLLIDIIPNAEKEHSAEDMVIMYNLTSYKIKKILSHFLKIYINIKALVYSVNFSEKKFNDLKIAVKSGGKVKVMID